MKSPLSLKISGQPLSASTPVLFFLAGFPDTHNCWDSLAAKFADSHTIATTCWPDYEQKARWPGTGRLRKFFGYSHDEVVDRALATVESAAPGRKITLVAHDWGAFAAYAMIGRRPELFERAVMFDIGLITPKLLPKLSWLVIGLYQWWLALAFVVSQVLPIVGTLVGDVMLGVFPWRLAGPCPHDAKVGIPRPWREVHSWMCYPYLRIWRDILLDFRGTKKTQVFPPSVGVPTLFMYGEKKRTMYHTPDFLEKLDADAKSRWRSLPHGHWLYVQDTERCAAEMRAFLQES